MASRVILVLAVLPVILALTGSLSYAQTEDDLVTGGTDAPDDGAGTLPPEVARATRFRCYTCQDSYDNVKCNGRLESENGSAVYCPNARDTCYTKIRMNPEGDGFMIRKGCMDLDECYDAMYSDMNDPEKATCFIYMWPYDDETPPAPGLTCHYCSNEWLPLDLSNHFHIGILYGTPRINNWDPRMNWDLTMDYVTPTAPESGSVRPLPLAFGQLVGVVASVAAVYVLN